MNRAFLLIGALLCGCGSRVAGEREGTLDAGATVDAGCDGCDAAPVCSTDRLALRIATIQWNDPGLEALQRTTDAALEPWCADGLSSLNVILRYNMTTGEAHVGNARTAEDGVSWQFTNESLSASKRACPWMSGVAATGYPAATTFTRAGGELGLQLRGAFFNFFESRLWALQLRELRILTQQPTSDEACPWRPLCSAPSVDGRFEALLPLETADNIGIASKDCISVCALLANGDPTKIDGGRCKRGPDGKVLEFGNACLDGGDCKDAIRVSATFTAQSVRVVGPL